MIAASRSARFSRRFFPPFLARFDWMKLQTSVAAPQLCKLPLMPLVDRPHDARDLGPIERRQAVQGKCLVLHVRDGGQLGRGDVVIARRAHKRAQRPEEAIVPADCGLWHALAFSSPLADTQAALPAQMALYGPKTSYAALAPGCAANSPQSRYLPRTATRKYSLTRANRLCSGAARAVSPRWTGLAKHHDGWRLPVAGFWTIQDGSGSSLLSWVSQKACTLAGPSQSRVSSG